MGNWFSNIHIRKNSDISFEDVTNVLIRIMSDKGYQKTENPDSADTEIACLFPADASWISLSCDALAHDGPESSAAIASPLSALLHTDVLAAACFDSDYLYLNLINADEGADGWIGIGAGKDVGISRRNNLSVWKKKISNYPDFADKVKTKYVVADQFLQNAAVNLGMDFEQSTFNGGIAENCMIRIFFERVAGNEETPELAHYDLGLPCFMNQTSRIYAVNVGAEGTGLSIYLLGSYVEHEEITFADIEISCQDYSAQIQLSKEQLSDGRWAYAYHDPLFQIPSKAPARLRKDKKAAYQWERRITLSFLPCGNPRKILDITVSFIPHENPHGGTQWNVWQKHGSKTAFIQHYNKIWKRVRAIEADTDQCLPYLKEEDFDE